MAICLNFPDAFQISLLDFFLNKPDKSLDTGMGLPPVHRIHKSNMTRISVSLSELPTSS